MALILDQTGHPGKDGSIEQGQDQDGGHAGQIGNHADKGLFRRGFGHLAGQVKGQRHRRGQSPHAKGDGYKGINQMGSNPSCLQRERKGDGKNQGRSRRKKHAQNNDKNQYDEHDDGSTGGYVKQKIGRQLRSLSRVRAKV